jgi:protein-S-isoprenylcysteine O-methyltransferase Ste14
VDHFLRLLHPLAWLVWILYWRIAGINTKETARRDTSARRWLYTFPIIFAAIVFVLPAHHPALRITLFPDRVAAYAIGTALLLLGMAISIWARVELGRNWSNVVTVKVGHELVQSGPYRWVRHPIYTGILVALAGSALAEDFWIDLVIVPIVFVAFWIKLRLEEDWMRGQFGAAYDAYCARTKRLIPYLL